MCTRGLVLALGGLTNLIRFHSVQVGPARYFLRCVVFPGFDQEARVAERVRAVLGPGAEIAVECVSDIPPLASGKRPAVLNRMSAR